VLDTIKVAGDLAGQSDDALLALKTNPGNLRSVRDAYAAQNGAILSKAGHPVTPGNTYLAHFAGPKGPSRSFRRPDYTIDRVLDSRRCKGQSLPSGDDRRRFEGVADRQDGWFTPAQATPASPPSTPLNLAPQARPIFRAVSTAASGATTRAGHVHAMPAQMAPGTPDLRGHNGAHHIIETQGRLPMRPFLMEEAN